MTTNNSPSSETVTVNFYGPSGACTPVKVPVGSTIEVLLDQQGINREDSVVRVNRATASPGTPLKDGDAVTVSPAKVAGNIDPTIDEAETDSDNGEQQGVTNDRS